MTEVVAADAPNADPKIPGLRSAAGARKPAPSTVPDKFLLQGGKRSGDKGARPIALAARPKSAKWQLPKPPPPRRSTVSIVAEDAGRGPPPLALALERDGLGHYARKLCDELSCSTVQQLLQADPAGGDTRLRDALMDVLRPLPGHRARMIDFLAKMRREQDEQAPEDPATPAQRQAWRATLAHLRYTAGAAKRGRDGPIAHISQSQPLNWGVVKGDPPKPTAYTQSGESRALRCHRCCFASHDVYSRRRRVTSRVPGVRAIRSAGPEGGQEPGNRLRRLRTQLAVASGRTL